MNPSIARYRTMLEQHPENELARFSLAKAYYDAGEFALALEQFELALRRKPDWMVAQILVGKSELALGHETAARTAFTRARELALEQNHEGPLAEMSQLLADLGAESS